MIYLKNKVCVTDYTTEQASKIKQALTITNPLFSKKAELGLGLWGISQYIKFYEEVDKKIYAPIGATKLIKEVTQQQVIDERFVNNDLLDIKFLGTLKPYQLKASNDLLTAGMGVLEAPTGSGKTICIIDKICKLKQPTLILTHTKELQKQFTDRLLSFTNIKKVGQIGSGKYKIESITVGLLQSVNLLPQEKIDELNSLFGCVILDEAHISPAETFYNTVNKLNAKYKYGMTATPFRTDGLTDVIFFIFGKIEAQIKLSEIKSYLSKPTYEKIETSYYFPLISSDEYLELIGDLTVDNERNKFIVDNIQDILDKPVVILSTRIEQLQKIQALLNTGDILTSKLNSKKRVEILNNFINKKTNIILSTYQLFATGIDIPHLEYLIMAAPVRSETIVRQAVGRIMRLYQNKTPVIRDFVDVKVSLLKNQAKSREFIIKNIIKELS